MTEIFKAVEWMRWVRAQIDAEDESLGWSEKHEKTVALLETDPLWQKLKHRIVDFRASKA